MLELALKAEIPIIRTTTSDVLNVQRVLSYLAPNKTSVLFSGWAVKADIYYALAELKHDADTYERLVKENKILVLINQAEDSPFAFDAGEMPVPESLLLEDLIEVTTNDKAARNILPAFKGLTLKAAVEVQRMATAQFGELTTNAVLQTRALITGSLQGLHRVDVALDYYLVPDPLQQWLNINKRFFVQPDKPQLIPRGIVFSGIPGVGKSQGAKYIAQQFGVPLYRFDLAGSLGKFVGESEQALARLLNAIDAEAPALFLLDEVEKIFASGGEDSGVTARLLSQLLWWLSEHKSRVFTVMTTNNLGILPPELYRPGRIDEVFTLQPLSRAQSHELIKIAFEKLVGKPPKASEVKTIAGIAFQDDTKASHAQIVKAVHDYYKTTV
jgi:hypothetical protein